MTGYVSSVNMPENPYQKSTDIGVKESNYGPENRQFIGDMNMANYSAQMHQAELLKQRQWALEDANYNSPAELRKRLEQAGYNPSLMSGMVQTANQPVRAATANTPNATMSNMSGYAAARQQAGANLLKAGENIAQSFVTAQNIQNIRADTNLKNSQSVKALSESAMTNQQRSQANDLFNTQKQALIQDLLGKTLENRERDRYYHEQMPEVIKNLRSNTNLSDAKIGEIEANVKDIQSRIDQRLVQNKATREQIKLVQEQTKEIFNRNSTFNQTREQDVKQLEYELLQLKLNLEKYGGVNTNNGSLLNDIKRTIYMLRN